MQHPFDVSLLFCLFFVLFVPSILCSFLPLSGLSLSVYSFLSIQGLGKSSKPGSGGVAVTRLSVENSDISEEETDMVVNTTTEEMKLSNSAVSKALLSKAGPILQRTCDQLVESGLRLDHGEIALTNAFGTLKCKKIIHAHLPPRGGKGVDHASVIAEIVKRCLAKAESLGMKSISFPAFGFGQGRYSVHEVAEPMLTAFREYGKRRAQGAANNQQLEVIRVVIFNQQLHKQFFDFFVSFFKVDVSAPLKFVSALRSKGQGETHYVELQDETATLLSSSSRASNEVVAKSEALVFTVFASSKDKCTHVTTRLKEHVKQKCAVDEIRNPVVANLIDDDIADIKQHGAESQVRVNVIPRLQKIDLQGEVNQVTKAKCKIVEVLGKIEKAEGALKVFQWQTETGDDIEPYSPEASFKLERAREKDMKALTMVIDNIEVVVDLEKMEERSLTGGDVRKVTRVPIKPKSKFFTCDMLTERQPILNHYITLSLILFFFAPVSFPGTWESQPTGEDGNTKTVHMTDVAPESEEYKEAVKNFISTVKQTVTIVSLKRVQNPGLYTKHVALQETLCSKYAKRRVETKQLFHGCKEDTVKYIATQGFNRSLAASAHGQPLAFDLT